MDTYSKKVNHTKKTSIFVCVAFLGVFIVFYSIMSTIAPAKKLAELKSEYGIQKSEESKLDENIFSDSAYASLLKKKAFLQAKVAMAETDSICLSLNLEDSTVVLEISGVKVHETKMRKVQVSKIIRSGDPNIISNMLSVPLNVLKDYATIRKEPLMIKMAPKDTSEYKPDIIPDTSDYEPVNYILETNRGLRIFVYQYEETTKSERSNLFFFDLNDRLRNIAGSLKNIVAFKVPEYHPYIKIRLPKADAKIVYRALPRYGQITVYI